MIRDPRGVSNSRLKIHFMREGEDFVPQLQAECGKYRRNIEFLFKANANQTLKHILQENMAVVRYEDVIQDFYTIARKLYKFLNLHMPREVEEFVRSNARISLWGPPNFSKNQSAYSEEQKLQKWRKELDFHTVQQIQNVCHYTMDILGYKLINRESEMKTLGVSVIGKVNEKLPYYVDLA